MPKLSDVVYTEGLKLKAELLEYEEWGHQEMSAVHAWINRVLKHGATPPGYPDMMHAQPRGQRPK